MASPFPSASITLDYPLYALDFDPQDANRLVVGGGGGAGRSGVGNKITVVETASQHELRVAGEVELSRDEDSVMSLAIGEHKGRTTYVHAGVNSSHDSIAKGKNEHFRTLNIEQSKSRMSAGTKTPDVNISELSRSALFVNPEADMYQRLLRVAGSVGAAATAMGKDKQLVVFETAGATTKSKGILELPKEAEDLDIVQKGEKEFQVAFCYKYELHIVNIGGNESQDPRMVFAIAEDETERPVFRSIRYLTPEFIIAVANLPKRSGVVIQVLRLPSAEKERARLAVNARIPRKISATALAVTNLSPPASPTDSVGETQFLIAIAGHDSSISLYTLEHQIASTLNILKHLYPCYTLKDVHGSDNITGVAFSTFSTPKSHIRPQFIKLASISLQKTVAVHNIPLKKYIDKAPRNRKGPPRPVRYVSALKSQGPSNQAVFGLLAVLVLIMAIIAQGIMEMYGNTRPILHVERFLPSWHGTLRSPDHPPTAFLADEFMSKLLGEKKPQLGETLVIREATPLSTDSETEVEAERPASSDSDEAVQEIQVDIHDPNVHGPGKTWEELGEEQKEAWKARLKGAGAWTQSMGESVFKGILFGELAGAVGRAVGG